MCLTIYMLQTVKNEEARKKLIEAAGQIFAEVGYEAATVRQITDRAQVNLAAVNYYFGDKRQLYRTVLQSITGRTICLLKQHCAVGDAELRLHHFVRCVLMAENAEEPLWSRVLMAREVMELHEAQANLIVEAIRPMHEIAESIVRSLMGDSTDQERVRLATGFLVSLCVNRGPQLQMDRKLYPDLEQHSITLDIGKNIEALCRFAQAGICALTKVSFP